MPDPSKPPSAPSLGMTGRVLLGPGPSMVHPRVYAAMSSPVVGHLDPAYLEIMDSIQDLLRYLFVSLPVNRVGSRRDRAL